MEAIQEEVVSESSENSVDSLTQGEGNLTMAELASSLMQKRQTEETDTTEEESEPVAQSTEEEESEDQSAEEPEESDEESDEPPVQPSDVLSKFKDLDLDTLSEEESKELAKHLNASAIKRFGKLTAQKKALLAENQELQQQVEQAPVPVEQPAFLKDNALHNVNDVNALAKEVDNLNTLMEWADEGMENEVEYDDAGNEYVVKDGDKTYTKADLRRIKANAKKILRKDAPARETVDFLSDGESEDYKMFMQVKQSALYKPLIDHLPNSNFALGLMVEGLKAVKAKQANAGQPKKLKKPTAPVASAEAGASKPRTEGSKQKKAIQAAHAKFEKSGNIADYQNYIKLKRSIA